MAISRALFLLTCFMKLPSIWGFIKYEPLKLVSSLSGVLNQDLKFPVDEAADKFLDSLVWAYILCFFHSDVFWLGWMPHDKCNYSLHMHAARSGSHAYSLMIHLLAWKSHYHKSWLRQNYLLFWVGGAPETKRCFQELDPPDKTLALLKSVRIVLLNGYRQSSTGRVLCCELPCGGLSAWLQTVVMHWFTPAESPAAPFHTQKAICACSVMHASMYLKLNMWLNVCWSGPQNTKDGHSFLL